MKRFKKLWAELKDEYGFALCFEYPRNRMRAVMDVAMVFLRHFIQSLPCRWKGHAWEDHGYAGPESGAIDMECSRCGKCFHVQLY